MLNWSCDMRGEQVAKHRQCSLFQGYVYGSSKVGKRQFDYHMQCYKIFIIVGGASKNRAMVTSSSSDSIYKDAFYITNPISIFMVWIDALPFSITII